LISVRAPPQIPLVEFTALPQGPDHLAGFKGPTSKGRGGEGSGRGKEERKGEGNKGRRG